MRILTLLVLLLTLATASAVLAQTEAGQATAPLRKETAASPAPSREDVPDDTYHRSEHWRSVLLYAEFDGPAFDNCFNRKEYVRFIVSAQNGGNLTRVISLDYPEAPGRVFLGEIAVNQKELVLTAQATHSYLNPASSYKFPILNARNQQLLNYEADIKTATIATEGVVKTVIIKIIGREGWFSDPSYALELVASAPLASTVN